MTFRDPDYVASNNAGAAPSVVIGYQSERTCNITKAKGNYNQGECHYGGPGYRLREHGPSFASFRALQMWSDSAEQERKGLGRRAMSRLLAPQSQEAPFTFHTGTTDVVTFRALVDQLSSVGGFDMIMMSFGSGFTMEDTSPVNLAKIAALIEYARAHNIEVGGYDLISEKTPTAADEVFATVNPTTNKTGGSLCFASGWRRDVTKDVLTWVEKQNLTAIETDGPYGGAMCGSHNHDHYDADDSIYMQQQGQVEFYQSMRERGVYVNAPDDYLFEGGANKVCGGYTMFSSTRSHWEMLQIQRLQTYDQLFVETPSMEWMLAPLDPYGGGGTNGLEPLSQNVEAYNWTLGSYLGYGLSGACFRGHRVYDSPAVEAMVKMWTGFWQRYRIILAKDIIHVRRPDYQSIDAVMHVDGNRSRATCGLLMVYNPTDFALETTLDLDVWYTSEAEAVLVTEHDRAPSSRDKMAIARDYTVPLHVALPARGMTYFVLRRPGVTLQVKSDDDTADPSGRRDSDVNVLPFSDTFDRVDGPLSDGWMEGSAIGHNYSKLGIYGKAVSMVGPMIRKGKYPLPGNKSATGGCYQVTAGEIYPGIGCAWRETGATSITVTVRWSGLWSFPHHIEAAPLLHVTPGTRSFGIGIWPSILYNKPVLFIGTIGNPGRFFNPMDAAVFNHTDGQAREIGVQSNGAAL